jgi:hypothetical protein
MLLMELYWINQGNISKYSCPFSYNLRLMEKSIVEFVNNKDDAAGQILAHYGKH